MKLRTLVLVALVASLADSSELLAQFRGGGGGRGFGRGGRGGGGGGGAMFFLMQDPEAGFERMAKGRDYFLISETFSLREPLTQFAKDQGIADDKITREHFRTFGEQWKAKLAGAAGTNTPESGSSPGATEKKPESGDGRAEFGFRRLDTNGDGVLNLDEMPTRIREDLAAWDKNGDKMIDLNEFRAYIEGQAQQSRPETGRSDASLVIEINDEELERRPVVYRAGKLPKELESMFKELDSDGDGQIDLAEWRAAEKSVAEFRAIDRNEDGLLTADEILRHRAAPQTARKDTNGDSRPSEGFGRGGRGGGFRGGQRSEGGGGPSWMRFRRSGN